MTTLLANRILVMVFIRHVSPETYIFFCVNKMSAFWAFHLNNWLRRDHNKGFRIRWLILSPATVMDILSDLKIMSPENIVHIDLSNTQLRSVRPSSKPLKAEHQGWGTPIILYEFKPLNWNLLDLGHRVKE